MTLFDDAGGAPAVLALATDFHARCRVDPELEHPFSKDLDPDHVRHLAEYWGEIWGGPPRYSERGGGHRAVLRLHAGQGMGSTLGERFVACFDAALESTGIAADERTAGALRAYIRWATAEVMHYAPDRALVPAVAPMPRWDVGGLVTDAAARDRPLPPRPAP